MRNQYDIQGRRRYATRINNLEIAQRPGRPPTVIDQLVNNNSESHYRHILVLSNNNTEQQIILYYTIPLEGSYNFNQQLCQV